MEQQKILSELAQFTGVTRYYRSGIGSLRLTEGAHYLRERLDCYWLIDIVESNQPRHRGEQPAAAQELPVSDLGH